MTHEVFPPLAGVTKIGVFRPNALGDFMFALPALHALRSAYPHADIVYLGRTWHAEFLTVRSGPVDRVVVVPPMPGMGQSAEAARDTDAAHFVFAMVEEGFDLVLQMYGGGRFANPLVKSFGARLTVGMQASDASPLDRSLAYGPWQNRRAQLLEVAALAGAARFHLGRELVATDADVAEAADALPGLEQARWVVIHPGASDARRRWSPARFAVVADVLAAEGLKIAVHGTADEAPLVRAVIGAMKAPAVDLSGVLSLSGLCGLLSRTALLVSNDTGPLHMALALGTPSVGIYWFGNLLESGPLRQQGHRAAVSSRIHCPVCGAENIRQRCPHNDSFVDDVSVEEVVEAALALLTAASD